MSIYGISTEFTESIRFVTIVHSTDLFSVSRLTQIEMNRNGLKWPQTNTERSFGTPRPIPRIKLMYRIGQRVPSNRKGRQVGWAKRSGAGRGGAGQARPRHGMARHGRVA